MLISSYLAVCANNCRLKKNKNHDESNCLNFIFKSTSPNCSKKLGKFNLCNYF